MSVFSAMNEGASATSNPQIYERSTLQKLKKDDTRPVSVSEQIQSGQALFSDQANCPFRAFARHRLGLREPASPEPGLTPALRGTAVHIALETFYQDINDSSSLALLE
ncbi:MAG: PD-(D/E)XK nuclease family protein [Cyanobacteria bacterium P01_E01_bin.43]